MGKRAERVENGGRRVLRLVKLWAEHFCQITCSLKSLSGLKKKFCEVSAYNSFIRKAEKKKRGGGKREREINMSPTLTRSQWGDTVQKKRTGVEI